MYCVRLKPAVPWGPEAARRVFSAMVTAVRPFSARHARHTSGPAALEPPRRPDAASFSLLVLGAACAQAGRVLAVPAVPGAHPLRALGSADGAVRLLAPEWAEISCAADPVLARMFAFFALGTEWQWTARPAEYARVLASSDLLRQSTRLLALGGAFVESLEGRCAEPGFCSSPDAAP